VEWRRGDTAMKSLEDPNLTGLPEGIPYGVCVGNHDQSPNGDFSGTTSYYNKYFGKARFTGRSYYGGHYATNNNNFYDLFSVGNIDFLVLYFEFNTSTTNFTRSGGPLDWGESIIKSYPKRNVIVISHYVLSSTASFTSQGLNIYKRFKIYPNFKLMFGGHVPDSAAEAVKVSTSNGNTVYTVLSNYQGRAKGGNGLLRIYQFDPANNNVAVKTYSPYTGAYETDANSQFNMNVKLITNTGALSSTVTTSDESISENKLPLNKQKPSFTIFPNPNNTHHVTISLNEEIKGNVTIEIYNITGNLLFQKTFMSINKTFSIEHHLSPGTYLVVIKSQRGKDERTLIVVK